METTVKVDISGAIWENKAHKIVIEGAEQARHELAKLGLRKQQHSTAIFKQWTGNYYRHLKTLTIPNADLITDSGIIYGRWLEVGSPSTRFKGYHLWTKTTVWLHLEASKRIEGIGKKIATQINA